MRRPTLPILGLALLAGCGARSASRPLLAAPSPEPAAEGWRYEVVEGPGAERLAVEAVFAAGTEPWLTVEDGGEPFVRNVEIATPKGWLAIAEDDRTWRLPSCREGCRVRYQYLLQQAARANDDVAVARLDAGAVEAPPSTWLLRPVHAPLGTPFRFHVTTAPGDAFVTGVFSTAGDPRTYEGHASRFYQLPYSVFGSLRIHELLEGRVEVAILPGSFAHEGDVLAWVEFSARAVERFYGEFPVRHLALILRPKSGSDIGFGTTMGNSGAAITLDVGGDCTRADLRDDWVLVHEMVHTALPDVEGPQHWLEEGLATYVEPLARERAGIIRPEEVWGDWVRGMPKGQPQQGDQGLDRTHTWGRTYWGGALFCLSADVAIRERTGGRKSLDDALRAIVAKGGNIASSWPMERVVEVGDEATGVSVLHELYARMANAPVPVDLPSLWSKLGVTPRGRSVAFDDSAPLASLRRDMTPMRGTSQANGTPQAN